MSNIVLHAPHFQRLPGGGAALHHGQANPSRRGNFAKRNNATDCFSPAQQFNRMNTERTPNQIDPILKASTISPATPTKPISVASIKLRARPTTNQSRDRKIWPPSSGKIGSMLKTSKTTSMTKTARTNSWTLGRVFAQPNDRLNMKSTNRIGTRATFTSGPAAMLHSVAPGRGGGSTNATPPRGQSTIRFAMPPTCRQASAWPYSWSVTIRKAPDTPPRSRR